jgi:hypothetical protein
VPELLDIMRICGRAWAAEAADRENGLLAAVVMAAFPGILRCAPDDGILGRVEIIDGIFGAQFLELGITRR